MLRWKIIIAINLLVVAGASQVYAQGTLTTQDYIEIQQLYATYAQAIDLGRGPAARTFTPDGEFFNTDREAPIKGSTLVGGGAVRGRRHGCINLVITATPEGAKGSCYLLELDTKNVPATIVLTGVYDDDLVKTPGGWRFKKRVESIDGTERSPYNPPGGTRQFPARTGG